VIEGRGVVLISYSERFRDRLAAPVAERLRAYGLMAVLVGDEPLPDGVESNPDAKVRHFFARADMIVYLATPDDRVRGGEVRTRQNIIDELRLGMEREHVKHKLLVFKDPGVVLPSNINPVHEPLPIEDPGWIAERITRQAEEWGVLAPGAAGAEPAARPRDSEGSEAPPVIVGQDDEEASRQASTALRHVQDSIQGNAPQVEELERAELLVSSLTAAKRAGDVIGALLANRMFARRKELQLRASERVQLVRTWLRNYREQSAPGVYWIGELGVQDATSLLIGLARSDSDGEIRAQALRILGRLRRPRGTYEARSLVEPFLKSDEFQMRWAGLDYLRERGASSLRDLIGPELLERDQSKASETAALIDVKLRPGDVLRRYASKASVRTPDTKRSLIDVAQKLPRTGIVDALESRIPDVAVLGAELVAIRPDIARARIERAMSASPIRTVRARCVLALVERGVPITDGLLSEALRDRDDDHKRIDDLPLVARARLQVFLQREPDDLEPTITWTAIDGAERYEAAMVRRPDLAHVVRKDLRESFLRLRERGRRQSVDVPLEDFRQRTGESVHGPAVTELQGKLEEKWAGWGLEAKLGAFLLSEFEAAAFRVLAVTGGARDARFARELAPEARSANIAAAVRVLERFGSAHDTARVIGMIDRLYDEGEELRAAALAYRLAYKKDKLRVLQELRDRTRVRDWAIARLAETPGGPADAVALLRDEDAAVRLKAAEVVLGVLRSGSGEGFLEWYMSGWHYFNVVTAFDEQLYAPDWLRRAISD
jgi:hypothetical protein